MAVVDKAFPKVKYPLVAFIVGTVGFVTFMTVHRRFHLQMLGMFQIHGTCPDVLKYMVVGTWATRHISKKEEDEIEAFLLQGLYPVNGSSNLELNDKRCGNVSYYPWKSHERLAAWTRALCNPRGNNPCCYNNKCQMKTIQECVCENCYDLRPQIHAEYSDWIPDNARCQLETFTPKAACDLLRGGTYHFYGDSIVRMVFLAFIIILKGDNQYGGLRPNAPAYIKKKCSGMYVFPTKNCRQFLDYTPTLCNGTITVLFRHYPRSLDIPKMRKDVKQIVGKPKSIIFFGAGTWQHFDISAGKKYASEVISVRANNTWPKLLWSGFHYFGSFHRALVPTSNNDHAEKFNMYMKDLVEASNVPMFDTFNMTKGVRSVDGVHYGPGVNFVKARIFLHYMQELQRQGKW